MTPVAIHSFDYSASLYTIVLAFEFLYINSTTLYLHLVR